jgi:hypothetical protein
VGKAGAWNAAHTSAGSGGCLSCAPCWPGHPPLTVGEAQSEAAEMVRGKGRQQPPQQHRRRGPSRRRAGAACRPACDRAGRRVPLMPRGAPGAQRDAFQGDKRARGARAAVGGVIGAGWGPGPRPCKPLPPAPAAIPVSRPAAGYMARRVGPQGDPRWAPGGLHTDHRRQREPSWSAGLWEGGRRGRGAHRRWHLQAAHACD